jgi:alpha-1,2-rhamnosyltransferase
MVTDLHTGIQRVVRNVIRHADLLQEQLGVECVPVTIADGGFYDVRPSWRRAVTGRVLGWLECLEHHATARYDDRPLRDRLYKLLYPKTPMRKFMRLARRVLRPRVKFAEGDVLLMLDASWNLPAWPAVERAKQQGCRVGCVSYDLIPLETPQFCVPSLVKGFLDWFGHAVRHADFFIAISQHVSRRLDAYIRASYPDVELPPDRFDFFRLGADFSPLAKGKIRPELRDLFARGPAPYLTVGTIAPHKNHSFLLDAFDLARASCPETRLVLVGKVGWMCDDIVRRITQHPAFGSSLFLFAELTDAELRLCYERCRALVAPSLAEGFGLPLVEAFQHGLPVMASNTPIHREVGRDDCAYFDLETPVTLANMIRNIELHGKLPPVRRSGTFEITSWEDSCRELLTKALRISRELPAATPRAAKIPFASQSPSAATKSGKRAA